MPPSSSSFTPLNLPASQIPESMSSFTLSAPPNTDLWRKPPSSDTSTAPILFTALRFPFCAAEVTVSADFEYEWDQAGLCIFAGVPPGASSFPGLEHPNLGPEVGGERNPARSRQQSSNASGEAGTGAQDGGEWSILPAYTPPAGGTKWVKASLELTSSQLAATSVFASGSGSDWSLTRLPSYHSDPSFSRSPSSPSSLLFPYPSDSGIPSLRLKLERIGYALWIYYFDLQHGWTKIREVSSFFWGIEDKSVRVGVYASRPATLNSSWSSVGLGAAPGLGIGGGVRSWDGRGGGGGGGGGGGEIGRNGGGRLEVGFEGLEIF
ncbi:hypothetical protein H2203_005582 [Taxawa tesnikishii (nom. ined.)]|nr:hypothetical protein H2203_005582 [Dothideales sp. JES 119]